MCRKARSFLQSKKIDFDEREYGKNPFSENELRDIIGNEPIEKFLNSRTPLYREKNMKQKPPTKDQAINLMLKDPNLLKRPVIIKGKNKLTGFNQAEVEELL
jgi:Spx/MgsR family transcriptional regulator